MAKAKEATVVTPFNTTLQRFAVGVTVKETDDLSPLNYDHLKKQGFIEEAKASDEIKKAKTAE